jgi:tetratricopeptide (TPR) repeat protein
MSRWFVMVAVVVASAGWLPLGAGRAAGAEEPRVVQATPGQQGAAQATPGQQAGTQQAQGSGNVAPLLGNLGAHTLRITTASPLAQRYFDEGLNLTYGFNHAEAIRAFRDATRLDPNCAMCYWGIAYALGPNINAPMADAAVPQAYEALQRARALAANASPAERAYIEALAARYGPTPVADRRPLDRAYADAMREVVRRFPEDLEAATLLAEALMDLTPWAYWTKDGEPTEYTAEIVSTLERVLARNPNHPGAIHFYIHAVEASQTPERAVAPAQRLETLVPGAGHLVHMPGHIYLRVGRYREAVRVNLDAILSDETFIRVGGVADQPSHGTYVYGYYPHNIHFVVYGAQMSGQSALALEAARKLVGHVTPDVLRVAPGLEDFLPMPLFTLVRFERWDAVLAEPRPAPELVYATGMWHWARGLAYLREGNLEAAEAEQSQLAATVAAAAALRRSSSATLLEIASNILDGEIAGARGRFEEQLTRLARAVALEDDLPYIEPPAWFYPVRHTLGSALLRLGRAVAAEAVYREDLRRNPNNGWSLLGLASSLRAQGRTAEVAEVEARFREAWADADMQPTSSSF